jgi:hypothetical protein
MNGYKKIEYSPAASTTIAATGHITPGTPVYVYGSFIEIPVADTFGVETKSEIISGVAIYTTTISILVTDLGEFTRNTLHALTRSDYVFILIDVNNRPWVLGDAQLPFATVTPSFISESTRGGKHFFPVEIKYINRISLLSVNN